MDEMLRAAARLYETGKPRRVLSTGRIVFLVVAAAAPLAAMIGNLPIALAQGNGAGMPGAFLLAAVILLCFAVGYARISRRIVSTGAFYTYVVQGLGKVVGVGDSPKTELLWWDAVARDEKGVAVVTMRHLLRFLKATSPLYGA